MDIKMILELGAGIIMIGGTIGVFIERFKHQKGIGVRVIQFLAVILLIPTIFILALENILNAQTVSALLGAMIGYILSNIGKDEPAN
jgi:F0F1-type ATP synthase assembly protein I